MDFDYDLFVIGGGSGGVRAARISAISGAKVGLAEEYRMGGTCVIRGCVPKKLMVYASQFRESFEDAKGYGWTLDQPTFSWPDFCARRDYEVDRLEGIYRKNLKNAGVNIHDQRAQLASAHSVKLADGTEFTAKYILIATGGWPFVPDFEGSELVGTSNEIFTQKIQPQSVLIVGGGYIASEFAGVFNGLGTKVTQFYRGKLILRGFDEEVQIHVAEEMIKKGIDLRTETDVQKIEKVQAGLKVTASDGQELLVDNVFYATGRKPNTADLGLENLDIEMTKSGAIKVDKWSQTSVPSVFAVGDVTDRIALTPVAIREGHAFADTIFNSNRRHADHDLVATAVFTQPEIGTVGLTEHEARSKHEIEIYRSTFRAMYHVLANRDEKMLMKLIVDKASRVVLGAHIVGHGAGEMIQMVGVALKMGATKEQFDATVAVHPTAAEELVTMSSPVA